MLRFEGKPGVLLSGVLDDHRADAYDKRRQLLGRGENKMKYNRIFVFGLTVFALLSVSSVWGAQNAATAITVENAGNVKQIALLEGHTGPVFSMAFSPDGTALASGGSGDDYTVRLWDVASATQKAVLEGHTAQIAAVSFNAEGTQIESASYDHTIRLWDAATGAAIEIIDKNANGNPLGVDNLATYFTNAGSKLIYSTGNMYVFDMATRDETNLFSFDSPLMELFNSEGIAQLTPDAKLYAVEQVDGGPVHVIDVEAGTELKSLDRSDPESYYFASMAISPDGKWLAAADDTSAIIEVWNVETGAALPIITGHKPAEGEAARGVYGMKFNPDSSLLASASYDGTVRLWNPADATQLVSLPTSDPNGSGVVVWSPDGSMLASANLDGTVQIWGLGS
jgi:WD40 repeat protein